jgi:septal ring factor EnvC (AmiA/AmiB activator)
VADGQELRDARRSGSPVSARDAYLALQEQLGDQARRIDGLRRDLRRERARGAGDADEAPGTSTQLERLRTQLADAERELDEVDEKRAALAAELAEARAALREERASDEPPPRVAPG